MIASHPHAIAERLLQESRVAQAQGPRSWSNRPVRTVLASAGAVLVVGAALTAAAWADWGVLGRSVAQMEATPRMVFAIPDAIPLNTGALSGSSLAPTEGGWVDPPPEDRDPESSDASARPNETEPTPPAPSASVPAAKAVSDWIDPPPVDRNPDPNPSQATNNESGSTPEARPAVPASPDAGSKSNGVGSDRVFRTNFEVTSNQATSLPAATRPPIHASRLLQAEEAWQAGRFAEASELWRQTAITTGDLEVADWAAKAAARSGDTHLMAKAGAEWRRAHGGLGPQAGDREGILADAPNPGLMFFAGLLETDGYLRKTYSPSQGGPLAEMQLDADYGTWVRERTAHSHPFAIEGARQARTPATDWHTNDPQVNQWLEALPEYRAEVLQDIQLHRSGRWNTAEHNRIWAFVVAGGDPGVTDTVRELQASLNRTAEADVPTRPSLPALRLARAASAADHASVAPPRRPRP